MQKAKSRLKPAQPEKKKYLLPHSQTNSKTKKTSSGIKFRFPSKDYFRYLPLLLLSLPFYAGTYYIFNFIHPAMIQHLLIPNTYLPLQIVFFLGNFFFFSYLFLKTRRGFELSLVLSLALFLKLQQISNYLMLTGGLLLVVLALEALITLLKKE